MSHEDEGGDIAEDLSIKAHSPAKISEVDSSTLSPTPNSLIGELMSKFGFNDIQEYQEAYRKALQENGDSRLKENVNNNIGELKARLGGGEVVAGPGLVAREQENLFAGLWMP